jgi:hypothetical protein
MKRPTEASGQMSDWRWRKRHRRWYFLRDQSPLINYRYLIEQNWQTDKWLASWNNEAIDVLLGEFDTVKEAKAICALNEKQLSVDIG